MPVSLDHQGAEVTTSKRILLFLWLVSGTVVFVEPSPFDAISVALICSAVLAPRFAAGWQIRLALIMTTGLIASLFGAAKNGILSEGASHVLISIYLILLMLLISDLTRRCPEEVVALYAATGAVAALTGLTQLIGIVPITEAAPLYAPRVMGFFKDPNVFGAYLASTSVLCLALALNSNRRFALWLIGALITAWGVVLSLSRASMFSFLVSVAVFTLLYRRRLAQAPLGVLPIVALVGFVVALVSAISSLDTTLPSEAVLDRLEMQDYDQDRFWQQSIALSHISSGGFRILGEGFGFSDCCLAGQVHNTWLQALLEGGVVFFGAFSALMLLTVVSAFAVFESQLASRKRRVLAAALAATNLGTVISFFVIDAVHWRHLWIVMGISIGLSISVRAKLSNIGEL